MVKYEGSNVELGEFSREPSGRHLTGRLSCCEIYFKIE